MTSKWKEFTEDDRQKQHTPRKLKNTCQMLDCSALIKYKCVPPVEGFTTLYVCERHMPPWRDKDYKLSAATSTP